MRRYFCSGKARWRLGRQRPAELGQQQLLITFRLGVACKDQLAPVSGGEMHVEHLHRCELVQSLAHGEPGRVCFQLLFQRDVHAVGKERACSQGRVAKSCSSRFNRPFGVPTR